MPSLPWSYGLAGNPRVRTMVMELVYVGWPMLHRNLDHCRGIFGLAFPRDVNGVVTCKMPATVWPGTPVQGVGCVMGVAEGAKEKAASAAEGN